MRENYFYTNMNAREFVIKIVSYLAKESQAAKVFLKKIYTGKITTRQIVKLAEEFKRLQIESKMDQRTESIMDHKEKAEESRIQDMEEAENLLINLL